MRRRLPGIAFVTMAALMSYAAPALPAQAKATSSTTRAHTAPTASSPLLRAVDSGATDTVKQMVAKGADVNSADGLERTALSIAMEKGRPEVARFLLEHGAIAGSPSPGAVRAKSVVFPKSLPPTKTMLHANLLDAPFETRLALTILQGLVNREQPRIYITQHPGWHTPALIPKWMDGLRAKGYSFVDVPDAMSLFAAFRRCVKGAVLYEPDIEKRPEALHKLNALTLYCALNDAVLVTEEQNSRLRLPVLLDARGTLSTASEAYDWAYKELWPRANHSLLAFTCPSHIVLRDYLVENRVMPFWISAEMDADAETACRRLIDEAAPNSPVMGCWGGYGEQPAGRIGEPDLQKMTSERGKFTVVSDGCFDLSVHSGLTFSRPQKPKPDRYPTLNPPWAYVCLNFTDGDNLQYIQQYLCTGQWWADPNRGAVPLSWSINPSMVDLIPDVLEYLIATSTPNDELVCSGAGVGIALQPTYAKRCPNRRSVCDQYMKLARDAMGRAGFTSMHICDSSGVAWNRADFNDWGQALPNLTGILGDYSRMPGVDGSNADFTVGDGIPVARALIVPTGPMNGESLAALIRAATPKQRPAFMHVPLCCWFNSPSVALDAMQRLGPEYVAVTPSEFFQLMRIPEERTLNFQFGIDAEGWGNSFDMRDMTVKDGILSAMTTRDDPYWIRGNMNLRASDVHEAVIRMKVGKGGGGGQFFWVTDTSNVWDEAKSVPINVIPDGQWHEYPLPLSKNPRWSDTIIGVRIDPTCNAPNVPVAVDYIRAR